MIMMTTSAATTTKNSTKNNSFLDYERANSTPRWLVTETGRHANKITIAIDGTHTKKTQINFLAPEFFFLNFSTTCI